MNIQQNNNVTFRGIGIQGINGRIDADKLGEFAKFIKEKGGFIKKFEKELNVDVFVPSDMKKRVIFSHKKHHVLDAYNDGKSYDWNTPMEYFCDKKMKIKLWQAYVK